MGRAGMVERAVICVAVILAKSAAVARRSLVRSGKTPEVEMAALREDGARKDDEIAILRAGVLPR